METVMLHGPFLFLLLSIVYKAWLSMIFLLIRYKNKQLLSLMKVFLHDY